VFGNRVQLGLLRNNIEKIENSTVEYSGMNVTKNKVLKRGDG
jgi:hypothetical protein